MWTVSLDSSLFADSATSKRTGSGAGEQLDDAPGEALTGLSPLPLTGNAPSEDDVDGGLGELLPDMMSESGSLSDALAEPDDASLKVFVRARAIRTGAALHPDAFPFFCPSADTAPLLDDIVSGLGDVDDAIGAGEGIAMPRIQSRDTADNLREQAYPPGRQIHPLTQLGRAPVVGRG